MDDFGRLLAKMLLIAFALACFSPLITIIWNSNYVLQFRYNFDFDKIVVPPRPIDCDFTTAPFGVKQCRYEVQILAEGGVLHVYWWRVASQ